MKRFCEHRVCILVLLIILAACSSEHCMEGPGEHSTTTISLDNFEYLYVDGVFDVVLHEDTANFVIFEGGENLLKDAGAIQQDTILHLINENSCFMRPVTNRVKAHVHFKNLRLLKINHPSYVTSSGTITTLRQIIKAALVADVDLELNCENLLVYDHKVSGGTLKMKGSVDRCKFILNYALQTDLTELYTRDLLLENNSIQDIYVNAEEKLLVRLYNEGNIY